MNYQHILNLSDGFNPFGNGEAPARLFSFPGGEQHIDVSNIPENSKSCLITTRFMDSSDVMRVLLTADALKRHGIRKVGLYAPYFPYARQDRVAVKGDPLSISVMARLINSCGFRDVFVLDAHSPVTLALIDNVRELDWEGWIACGPMDWLGGVIKPPYKTPLLLAPDAGAVKKVEKVARNLKVDVVSGRKYRDPVGGELSVVLPTIHGRQIVVVDDICDGGATFLDIAKQLRGGNRLHLVVTHGIFSKGLGPLFDAGYESIHTSDSWGNGIAAFPDFYVHRVPTEVA